MQVELRELNPDAYGVFIIGSGPAGTLLADRLAAKGIKSLIIETGKADFDAQRHRDFSLMKGYGHFDGDYWPNHWLHTFGGTSTVWAGWCAPMDAVDFEDWPIGASDLADYYTVAAERLERDPIINTWTAPFIDDFRAKPFSVAFVPLRVGEKYFSIAQSRRDIDIVFEASAVQLTPNDGRSRLNRLSLVSGETRRDIAIKPGQRVVLAAGGIGNAQLMLAPTGNSEIGLGNETDMVGRCLMEHPHFYSVARTVTSRSMTFPAVPDAFGRHAFAVVAEPTLRDRIGGLSVSMEFAPVTRNTKDPTESYLQRKFGPDALTHILNVRSEMRPDPNNRVTLLAERDPAGLPRPKAVCSFGGDDLRAVNEALLALGHRLAEQDLGRLRIDNDILFRQATGGGHTMGTTRMGADPATSVVDADCRVHRYDNVYVAGSSVFTTGGASNPTLTIAALAARLADHLAEAQT